MKKIILFTSLVLIFSGVLKAQDIHFTQYFTSPLTLNPATTGQVPDDIRLAANYRTQWSSVSSYPYTTMTVSFDMAMLRNKLPDGDAIGIGVMGLSDKAGSGGLTNTTMGLSLAYHKGFGREKEQHISFGFQTVLVQKHLDFQKLVFEDMIDPATGLASKALTENLKNADLSYPDFNTGIMYYGKVGFHSELYLGYSFYHLTEPNQTFLQDKITLIHQRHTGYLGGSIDLNESTVLYASALYQTQASATEVLVGSSVGFILNPDHDEDYQRNTILFLGAWYRYHDAIAPYVAIEWSRMRIGLSYDINISNFYTATSGMGSYEISLLYFGKIHKRDKNPTYSWSCPKLW